MRTKYIFVLFKRPLSLVTRKFKLYKLLSKEMKMKFNKQVAALCIVLTFLAVHPLAHSSVKELQDKNNKQQSTNNAPVVTPERIPNEGAQPLFTIGREEVEQIKKSLWDLESKEVLKKSKFNEIELDTIFKKFVMEVILTKYTGQGSELFGRCMELKLSDIEIIDTNLGTNRKHEIWRVSACFDARYVEIKLVENEMSITLY